MHKRLLPASITVAVLASLALAGCSAGGGGGEKLDPEKTPLTEYYEAIYGGYDEKEQTARQNQVEDLVAACMAEEGFDYVPVDQSQYASFSKDDGEDRDTEEWVAAHGYGMTQTPEEQAASEEESAAFVDPNQDYVMALSESEQIAYQEVLYGPQPTEEEMQSGEYTYDWKTAGCQGSAQHEIQGDNVYDDVKYKPLLDDMSAIYEKVLKAPAVTKLDGKWSACMADAGYTGLSTKDDAMNQINDESNAYYETLTGEADPAKLAEIREHEIAIALADFTCSKKLDYEHTRLSVQFDLERQFITDHKSELDAMVADVAQGK
jgi:hypothetical protein